MDNVGGCLALTGTSEVQDLIQWRSSMALDVPDVLPTSTQLYSHVTLTCLLSIGLCCYASPPCQQPRVEIVDSCNTIMGSKLSPLGKWPWYNWGRITVYSACEDRACLCNTAAKNLCFCMQHRGLRVASGCFISQSTLQMGSICFCHFLTYCRFIETLKGEKGQMWKRGNSQACHFPFYRDNLIICLFTFRAVLWLAGVKANQIQRIMDLLDSEQFLSEPELDSQKNKNSLSCMETLELQKLFWSVLNCSLERVIHHWRQTSRFKHCTIVYDCNRRKREKNHLIANPNQ